jgi:hypothetical protein
MAMPAAIASISDSLAISATQERIRREQIRWRSLQHLDSARPDRMADAALLPLIQIVYPDTAIRELRRELDYLMECGLLTIVEDHEVWRLKLTWQGIDLVQYTAPCPAGIGRPPAAT